MATFQKFCALNLTKIKPRNIQVAYASSEKNDWIPQTQVTHTNQKWAADDYRNVRFIDKPKHVNPNFAINLIAQVPPKKCKERVVWCDGGSGATGHPRVFINLDKPGDHSCGYCGLRYVRDAH